MHFLYTQSSMAEPDHGLFLINRRKVELGKKKFYSKFRLRLPILKFPWIFRLKCCFVEIKDSCKKDFSNTRAGSSSLLLDHVFNLLNRSSLHSSIMRHAIKIGNLFKVSLQASP